MKKNNVLVIGGTGFIGSYIVEESLAQGFDVSILNFSGKGPFDCQYHAGDLLTLKKEDYAEMLQGIDRVVFAAGADERSGMASDPEAFYELHNIVPCQELFLALRESNVSHAVLLNSVFAMLNRKKPELTLAEKHPYIQNRVEQSELCHNLANDHFILTTLEVPWVFGIPHSGKSQWYELIQYARNATPILCCSGGASIISVKSLAEACVAALYKPTKSSTLAVGDSYFTFKEMMMLICQYSGRKTPRFMDITDKAFHELMLLSGDITRLFGLRSGIEIKHTPELVSQEIRVDNTASLEALGYTTGTAEHALQELVESVEENLFSKAWKDTLNAFQM